MNVGDVCVRKVTTADPNDTIRGAARRMLRESVGTLVIVDSRGDEPRAIGMVTDRDIVTRAVAPDRDLDASPLSTVMSVPVHAVLESMPLEDAVDRMNAKAVRRLVVTDDRGVLTGILALDDVLETLVREIDAIGKLIVRHPPIYG
ncbi:MAG: CBS domain-containing protein [Gemmatimonadota bacterium]|nr:CBS domain-containing protein [Gemmatimonadota bacterium]